MMESIDLRNTRWSSHTENYLPSKRHDDNGPILTKFGMWVCLEGRVMVESIEEEKNKMVKPYRKFHSIKSGMVCFHVSGPLLTRFGVWVLF